MTDLGMLPSEKEELDTYEFDGNRNKPVEAERRMWMAVLAVAVWDIQSTNSMHKVDEAMQWFLSYDKYVGSFYWVCTLLDLAPSRIRKQAYEQYCIRKAKGHKERRGRTLPGRTNNHMAIIKTL